MEALDIPAASPTSRKRASPDDEVIESKPTSPKPLNLKGTQFVMPTPPETAESSNASPTSTGEAAQAGSPAPSSSALSSVEAGSSLHAMTSVTDLTSTATAPTSSLGPPPAKRRKLTPAEKEDQKRQKDIKDREKAEQRTRKEEEKAKKDEEKRVKDEERRKKAEEREAKKREKELEEERKNQEKVKKERAQMRLGAFFQKPATPAKSPGLGDDSNSPFDGATSRRKSLSLEPYDAVAEKIKKSISPTKGTPQQLKTPITKSTNKPSLSDYRKCFLPFELGTHSKLASSILPQRSNGEAESASEAFDAELHDPSLQEKYDLGVLSSYASLEHHFAENQNASRGLHQRPIRQLVEQIQGSSQAPIDLTSDTPTQQPLDLLQSVSMKYLQFSEDVRPAYYGTYTKITSPKSSRKLRKNPFARVRKDTDYDYDSEAEWEEPEEGEDIVLDEDDEDDSVGDEGEMEGFLDDEDDALKGRRRMVGADLQPVNTGLCWEDLSGKALLSTENADGRTAMKDMKVGFLLPPSMEIVTIDPFSTAYWPMAPPPQPMKPVAEERSRTPLQDRTNSSVLVQTQISGAAEGMKGPITSSSQAAAGAKRGPKPSPKALSTEDLAEFREAVQGSDLGKIELSKALKQRFPKMTADVIKATLGLHFAQVGLHRGEKKWVWVDTS